MKRFTILEMLVVCAVIAVLLSLLLPSLANAREITKQVICLSNQSQISKGAYAYMTSNNYRLPSQQPKELASSTKSYWKLQIAEAMGETGFTNHKDIRLTVNVWECPKFPELFSDMVGTRHAGGIAYNGLGLRTKEVTSGTATCCPKYALNVGQVEFASETLMLSDIYDRPTNGARAGLESHEMRANPQQSIEWVATIFS